MVTFPLLAKLTFFYSLSHSFDKWALHASSTTQFCFNDVDLLAVFVHVAIYFLPLLPRFGKQ